MNRNVLWGLHKTLFDNLYKLTKIILNSNIYKKHRNNEIEYKSERVILKSPS